MGSTERPEHGDRPLSDAERIERYEERINALYSDPEHRAKLDPLAGMSREEIIELYRPEGTDDPNRPRVVFEGGRLRLIDPARDGPSEDTERPVEEPQWHEEPETVRQIRADHGDRDAGEREPAGEELLGASDRQSRRERLGREVVEKAGDWSDAGSEVGETLDKLLADRPGPTGEAETRAPYPFVVDQPHHGVESDSLAAAAFTTIVVLGVTYNKLRTMFERTREYNDAGD